MKTCYRIVFASLAVLLALASCRKENEQVVEWKTELQAVKSNLVFAPGGGTETLEVNLSSVTAKADKDWCSVSVSGNVISVTVTANENKQSRYAQVTISSGTESIAAPVIQYGEVFAGMEMEDLEVLPEGTTVRYSFQSNVALQMNSDQPWVHFDTDEKSGIVTMTVDEHKDFGYRYATVSYTAGSNSGSIKVSQEPAYREISGWSAAVTDGEFVFPDQQDVITVTPPAEMASATYIWDVADAFYSGDTSGIPAAVRYWALTAKNNPSYFIFDKGVSSKTKKNLPSTVTVAIICFDDQKNPTGQYALVEVPVPDRGPVKQAVDGWDIVHASGIWEYPSQTDAFTVTPKAGYEDVKYVATVVRKDAVSEIEDYAFTTFAMQAREAILAKVAGGELASFEDGLSTGVSTVSVENMAGDAYVVVVAFGENQFYTGDYKAVEVSIPDLRPAMYRWLGKWSVSRKNSSNDKVDTWEITVKEPGVSLRITGIQSYTDLTRFDVEAKVDEDGCLVLQTQYTGAYEDSDRGHVDVLLSGQYDDTEANKTYYTSSLNKTLFVGTLSEDGNSAKLTPGPINGYEFKNIQFYGRYKNSSGGTSAMSYSEGPTQLPQTITRIAE